MSQVAAILPVTVIAAIVLFFVKETVEYAKRRRADARKLQGIKAVIAREIEVNNWAIKSLSDVISRVEEGLKAKPQHKLEVMIHNNRTSYRIYDDAGGFHGGVVPQVASANLEKLMLEIATLDKELFEQAQKTYDEVSDLKHLRESLVQYATDEDPDFPDLMAGFVDYARRDLVGIQASLAQLYLLAAGKQLKDHRVR